MYPQKQPPQPSVPPHSYYEPQPQYASGIPAADDHHQYVPPPVYGQPTQPIPGFPARNLRWSSSLCSCWSDVPNCCLTCWCPCITFGQIAEIVDEGKTPCVVLGGVYALIHVLIGCGCLFSCVYRTKIRSQYGLDEAPCNDCLLHFFCEPCALCQEYRELKHQGFDLSMGWEGNLQMRNNGVQMPPMPPGGMNR